MIRRFAAPPSGANNKAQGSRVSEISIASSTDCFIMCPLGLSTLARAPNKKNDSNPRQGIRVRNKSLLDLLD